MKKILALICYYVLCQEFTGFCQNPDPDSIAIYQKEILKLRKRYHDSLRSNPFYQHYSKSITDLKKRSDNYGAFHLYFQISSADFSNINAVYQPLGFSTFKGQALGIGYGMSNKKRRRVFDWNITAFGIGKSVTSSTDKIRTSFLTATQFEWGYDFVKLKTINIYPYAGFGLRGEGLSVSKDIIYNSNPTNLTNIVQSNASESDYRTSLSYQAGIGFEFVLSNSEYNGGIILCIKAGTNRLFRNKDFSFGNFNYNPKFNYGAWYVTTGFKFFGR